MVTFSLVILFTMNHLTKISYLLQIPLSSHQQRNWTCLSLSAQIKVFISVKETKPFTYYLFVDGKKYLDFHDNSILIPIWNEYMYYNKIRRRKIEKTFFRTVCLTLSTTIQDLIITFNHLELSRINGFDCPKDCQTDHFKWDRIPSQKHNCIRYIYWTLMRQDSGYILDIRDTILININSPK
jgi:hypothetical protein